MPPAINRDTVSGEALFILRSLKENARLGRSNKLADVKSVLEPSVSLEFDSYFFFLRKFHYIAMDREAHLKLTDTGEAVLGGDYTDKFASEVGEFFQDQLMPLDRTDQGQLAGDLDGVPQLAPPPPPDDDGDDADGDIVEDDGEADTPPPDDLLLPEGDEGPPAPPSDDEPVFGRAPPLTTARVDVPDLKPLKPASPAIAAPAPTAQFGQQMPPPQRPAAAGMPSVAPVTATPNAAAGPSSDELRYSRFDPVGSGPLGTAFKGRHNALGLDVCLKELKDIFGYFSFLQRSEVLKRLKKELCAQAAVRHPCVVSITDQAVDGARPFFVMELCKGSLKERFDQAGGKGLSVTQSLRWFLQICYGLRAAHQGGLHHHNLKPENVLFDSYGNAKLSDFGMSRVIEVDQTKGMPQVFVGTGGMPYLAPELLNRAKDAGASADVYAAGILLYEMLTGQVPGRRSPMPSEVSNEIPSKIDPIFDKMTTDRRENRYADMDQVLTDFYGAFSEGEFLTRGDLVCWSEAPKAT